MPVKALTLLAPLLLMTGWARAYPSAGAPGTECLEVSAECIESAQASAAETAKQVQAGQDRGHGQITWMLTILKKERAPKKVKAPAPPNLSYDIRMHAEAIATTDWFLIRYDDLKPLLDYFKVKTPEELTGKSFSSGEHRAEFALDLLRHQIASHGTYVPPSTKAIYERTAMALSNISEPDFSDVDPSTAHDAFLKVFHERRVDHGTSVWIDYQVDEGWFAWLSDRVRQLSHDRVQLVREKESQPSRLSSFWEQLYSSQRDDSREERFLLISENGTEKKTQKLTLKPYIRTVIFED